LQLVPITACLW